MRLNPDPRGQVSGDFPSFAPGAITRPPCHPSLIRFEAHQLDLRPSILRQIAGDTSTRWVHCAWHLAWLMLAPVGWLAVWAARVVLTIKILEAR